jgi:hypothetical protein
MPLEGGIVAQETRLRLSYHDDWLYFDHILTSGGFATLVWQADIGAWYWDESSVVTRCHYGEEGGPGIHSLLVGGTDGKLYQVTPLYDDAALPGNISGSTISCEVRTQARDQGAPGNIKAYGDLMLDCDLGGDAAVLITPSLDAFNRPLLPQNIVSDGSGRTQVVVDLADITTLRKPVEAHSLGITAGFVARLGYPRLYIWEPRYLTYPENTGKRATDWDDAGHQGAKWVQGIIIEADTMATLTGGAWVNTPRTIQIQGDGGVALAAITVTHSGRHEKAYSWPGFFTHQMRLVPLDSGLWREFSYRWVWQPAPELAAVWETPDTTGGGSGFQHMRDAWVAHISTADISWRVTYDNVAYSYTIPSSGGRYVKTYVPLRAIKHRARRHKLTSDCPFRLYAEDSEVRVRDWGGTGPYRLERPFGGMSGSGAQV